MKSEVRRIAQESRLPSAYRKDSQGICFLGKFKYNDFLKNIVGEKEGNIVDKESGKIIGKHKGFWYHTIGQRKGLGLSGGPWFVVDKDIDDNVVYVSRCEQKGGIYGNSFIVTAFNHLTLSEHPWKAGEVYDIKFKIRHTEMLKCGKLRLADNGIDLNVESQNMSNRMNDLALKIDQVDKQLKAQLQVYRTARNPTAKAQAKKKAMQLLKKKKMYEQHSNNLSNAQMTLDTVNMDCQMMRDNMNIMQVMKNTVQVQKDTLHAMGGIDGMYDVMDDMAELKDEQQEINEEIQRNLDVDVGDEELDAELDELDYQMRVEMDNDGLKAPISDVNGNPIVNNPDEAQLEDLLK